MLWVGLWLIVILIIVGVGKKKLNFDSWYVFIRDLCRTFFVEVKKIGMNLLLWWGFEFWSENCTAFFVILILKYNCFIISERRRVLRLWPKKFQQRLLLLGVHLKDQELLKFIICLRRLAFSVDVYFLYLGLVLCMLNYVIFLVGFCSGLGLVEQRRRSRINEKMKALQNLIPNSNKVHKFLQVT